MHAGGRHESAEVQNEKYRKDTVFPVFFKSAGCAITYLRIAATPGRSIPSMYSSRAPPPVET